MLDVLLKRNQKIKTNDHYNISNWKNKAAISLNHSMHELVYV